MLHLRKFFFVVSALMALGLASQSSFACTNCPVSCIDIIPCPITPYVPPLTCDPKIEIYQIRGHFDYWTELMRTSQTCELTFEDYKLAVAEGMAPGSIPAQQQTAQTSVKIVVRSMRADVTQSIYSFAHQLDFEDRWAVIQGCYATPWLFLAELVSYDDERKPASGKN